ncbi:ubiquinone biosynthesis protein COQ4 [Novosphingobium sp. G106]|uniref:ubiquinone biosynthesis protein COQ4 n=1 Tax=Novosphingobium sp. G106 TaxID=2849500 RepID=UPI001C2DC220|nr:ubiquinone biosynthesis protein COQ4 [Novosphingobium sp. G106]MBV1689451.1 ubiquinone biosynthesis protein COQ4 [Novosphingobium sp. G106]
MTDQARAIELSSRRDWAGALKAVKQLMAHPGDTAQVFRIMRALNAGTAKRGYERLLGTAEGGRIAYEHVELAERLSDPAWVARFPEGSVGAAYAAFLRRTGYSAQGLAAVSRTDDPQEAQHPVSWFGRRTRDVHDIWHVLTGYRADDPLGEACLVAFSYAQTKGLGWALIAVGSALTGLRSPQGLAAARAIWEGYQLGRQATWLLGEDYEKLLAEPIDAARARLQLGRPERYFALDGAPRTIGPVMATA